MLFAAEAPERVEALVLVDTGPSLSFGGMMHIAEDTGGAIRSYASIDAFRERLAMTHPSADPDVIAGMAEAGVVRRRDARFEPALDPGVLGGTLDPAELDAIERVLWQALSEIRCPTLVVRGGISAILSEEVARKMIDEVLRDGRLETFAKAGHGVMLDDGPGLLRAIEGFLAASAG
jgi:pimeloyl-ACP methyl ester carboxylesterase